MRSPNSPTGVAGQWGRSPRLERKVFAAWPGLYNDNCMVPSPYLKKKKGNASENDAHASSILRFKFACPGGLSTMLEGNRQKRYGDRRGE